MPRIPGPNELSKRQIVFCPHKDRRYYAKGMCVNCYHRRGRTKKAWLCPHTRKTHYSKGLCKYCYLASYYKNRTDGKAPELSEDHGSENELDEAVAVKPKKNAAAATRFEFDEAKQEEDVLNDTVTEPANLNEGSI